MYVLIQNSKTRHYFSEPNNWTEDTNGAKQFSSTVDALEFVQINQLKDVQLLMKMGKPEFDVQLKVQTDREIPGQ